MTTHTERIRCPACRKLFVTDVEELPWFDNLTAKCPTCGYWITESEWWLAEDT